MLQLFVGDLAFLPVMVLLDSRVPYRATPRALRDGRSGACFRLNSASRNFARPTTFPKAMVPGSPILSCTYGWNVGKWLMRVTAEARWFCAPTAISLESWTAVSCILATRSGMHVLPCLTRVESKALAGSDCLLPA